LYAEVVNNNWQPAPASLVEVIETKQIKVCIAACGGNKGLSGAVGVRIIDQFAEGVALWAFSPEE
jgi:hypothetical protein